MYQYKENEKPKIGDIKKTKFYTKYIWTACIDCGKERWVYSYKGKPKSPRCNSCARKGNKNPSFGKRGEKNYRWTGYKRKKENKILRQKIKELENIINGKFIFNGKVFGG